MLNAVGPVVNDFEYLFLKQINANDRPAHALAVKMSTRLGTVVCAYCKISRK